LMPNIAIATAIANSKLLLAAVNDKVVPLMGRSDLYLKRMKLQTLLQSK
jgi:hypothetical protein